jgi:hypothetical protein
LRRFVFACCAVSESFTFFVTTGSESGHSKPTATKET